jgi:hypothetical protein
MSDRRGLGWLILGGAIALFVQVVVPVGIPLYDGVVIQEPYRYLSPASGQQGEPTSFVAEPAVEDGKSPPITAATSENPPQAQLIALPGSFTVPAGVATLHVAIEAVPPPGLLPTEGAIAGNVYRVSVSDPAGNALAIRSDQLPTLAMRAPDDVTGGSIARFADGRWEVIETIHASGLGIYSAEPDRLGDFAIVDVGKNAEESGPPLVAMVAAAAAVGAVVVALAIYLVRRSRRADQPASEPPPRRRAPSKRRRR